MAQYSPHPDTSNLSQSRSIQLQQLPNTGLSQTELESLQQPHSLDYYPSSGSHSSRIETLLMRYFAVSQDQVLRRLTLSLKPHYNIFFEEVSREGGPDLYGPFWIVFTAIFVLASVSNLAVYFADFEKQDSMIFAPSLLRYAFIFLLALGFGFPVILGFLIKLLTDMNLALPQVICIYGYSLTVFVLVAALCPVPSELFRWLLVLYGLCNSTGFLLHNLYSHIREQHVGRVALIGGLIVGAQLVLYLVFKLDFLDSYYSKQVLL